MYKRQAEEQARLGGRPYWGLIPADPYGTTVRRTPDNRLLIRNSFSFNPDGRSAGKYLERFAVRHRASFRQRFPMLPEVGFDYTWGGSLALSRNHMGSASWRPTSMAPCAATAWG